MRNESNADKNENCPFLDRVVLCPLTPTARLLTCILTQERGNCTSFYEGLKFARNMAVVFFAVLLLQNDGNTGIVNTGNHREQRKENKTAMRREINLEEISDGRFYDSNDMVRADCNDCQGCSDCCRKMGTSVILDPLDVHRLCENLEETAEMLLQRYLELNLVDGVILPNLKMTGERESCGFLTEEGRCGIHGFRPGICRLFPLGRFYENRSYRYFLQIHDANRNRRLRSRCENGLILQILRRMRNLLPTGTIF